MPPSSSREFFAAASWRTGGRRPGADGASLRVHYRRRRDAPLDPHRAHIDMRTHPGSGEECASAARKRGERPAHRDAEQRARNEEKKGKPLAGDEGRRVGDVAISRWAGTRARKKKWGRRSRARFSLLQRRRRRRRRRRGGVTKKDRIRRARGGAYSSVHAHTSEPARAELRNFRVRESARSRLGGGCRPCGELLLRLARQQ